jgi:prepilin-type N-terminal cleavage/methylation domain-containing protein
MVKKRMAMNRKGFSLTETMLVVAILGVVASIGPSLFTRLFEFYQLHNAKIEIQRDARAALENIDRFLRQGQNATVVIDQASGQPPYSRLSFTNVQGQNIMFYQQGTTLYQVAQSTTAIAQNLQYLAFTYPRSDDPTIISVAVTMQKTTYQGRYKALQLSIQKVRVMD